jgi:hypothetical protein
MNAALRAHVPYDRGVWDRFAKMFRKHQQPKGQAMTFTTVTRAECQLMPPRPGMSPMAVSSVHKIVMHHTDEPPPNDPHSGHDEAHDAAAGQWRSIQAYHMNSRAFDDIAYHYGIAPDGVVYEGRGVEHVGAHAGKECNPGSIGICFLMVDVLTDRAKRTFLELRANLQAIGFDVHEVEPHSGCNATYCPSNVARDWINAGLPEPGGTPEPPSPPVASCAALPPGPGPNGLPTLSQGSRGNVVKLLQQRLAELGHPPTNSRLASGQWDGIFGPSTAAAVRALQAAGGVQVDGAVGRQTWCVLGQR